MCLTSTKPTRYPVPLGLYVHWPFCRRICPYCDFNVRKHQPGKVAAMVEALCQDLKTEAAWRRQHAPAARLKSIHFGGGTPSMMPPQAVARLIELAQQHFATDGTLEIALEANPEDYSHFDDLAAVGINRLTLGIQAWDDKRLHMLGRAHDQNKALQAVHRASKLFNQVAADFIYATSYQTLKEWETELRQITALPLQHLSLYGLTIAPGTLFGKQRPAGLPDDDTTADFMQLSETLCHAAGYPQYEVSNFAKTEFRSVYNSSVWHSEDFIGIGAGAYGRRVDHQQTRHALRKVPRVDDYMDGLLQNARSSHSTYAEQEVLDTNAALQEWLIMHLRLTKPLNLVRPPVFCPPLNIDFTVLQQRLADTIKADLLRIDPPMLSITRTGRWQLDRVTMSVYDALRLDIDQRKQLDL